MAKGIADIVTIIILLLVAVSLAGAFFIWANDLFGGMRDKTKTDIDKKVNDTAKTIQIENVLASTRDITIRNSGSVSIPVSEISVYVGGALASGSWVGGVTSIAPNAIATYDAGAASCAGLEVKVYAPGNHDIYAC